MQKCEYFDAKHPADLLNPLGIQASLLVLSPAIQGQAKCDLCLWLAKEFQDNINTLVASKYRHIDPIY